MNLDRQLLKALVRDPNLLPLREEAQLRWATSLARVCLLRTPSGQDIDLSGDLKPFRQWLRARLREVIPRSGEIDPMRLRHLMPSIALRTQSVRRLLLDNHTNDFDVETLDKELRFKKLALALGGGGGSGFAHLGTFQMFESLNIVPELITGSSMGALMGLMRCLERSYSPAALTHTVPRNFSWGSLFRPFNGVSRFGFPGAFHMQLLRPAAEMVQGLLGSSRLPTFAELPIRFEVVATGVRTGFTYGTEVERELANMSKARLTPFAIRRKMKFFASVFSELAANPRLLRQIVFGADASTRDFNAVEAVGFSCSVPGLFCYDVFHDDPHTIKVLEDLVRKHRLWRFADGGVVNNVPSRVAWESVMRGNLGTRNVFIFAGDVFAPTNSAKNILFTPIQQIARTNVISNRPFADYLMTFQNPPSPLSLIPGWRKIRAINKRARAELEPLVPLLKRALTPLPPFAQISPHP